MTLPVSVCGDIDRLETTPYDGTFPGQWVQLSVATTDAGARPLYAPLTACLHEWLDNGLVEDFFFMHKAPGLRLRFVPAFDRAEQVRAEIRRRTQEWQETGLILGAQPGVYEPEAHLFGGRESMRHVHRLFTVDSMTWLDHHARPTPSPAWALSLLMLRALFDGLHVSGWEDRDVWARVAAAGRRLPTGAQRPDQQPAQRSAQRPDRGSATARLRGWWERQDELAAMLPPDVQRLADRHTEAVEPLLHAWWTQYFCGGHAELGPRQALAYYVVFHWNRAGLGFGRQVLITESLAEVEGARTDVL